MARPRLLLVLLTALLAAGCATTAPSPLDQPLVAHFFLEARSGAAGVAMQLPVSKITLLVNPKPVLVEYDLAAVGLVRVDLGWCMQFRFTPAAARDLYRLSAANIGGRLVLTFNDSPVGAGRINQAIGDGTLMIFVEVPVESLPPLVEQLNRTTAAIAKKAR